MKAIKFLLCKLAGKRIKQNEIDFKNISTILINPIGDAIGDTVVHTAHLNQLKLANPNLKIGFFASNRNIDILKKSDLVDIILTKDYITAFKQRGKWDLLLDFQPNFTSKLILLNKIIAPKTIIIFNKDNKKYYNTDRIKNYNYQCNIPDNVHMSDYLNHSILSHFIDPLSNKYNLTIFKNDIYNLTNKKIKILVSPFGSTREIPCHELVSVFNHLDKNIFSSIEIILTSHQKNHNYYQEFKNNIIQDINIHDYHSNSLSNYIELINQANIIVSVDSGTVHLACALKKPLLSFYANNSTNINKWHPLVHEGINSKIIISQRESHSNDTSLFPISEASNWLNKEIKLQLQDKK